jgi:3-phenylpropionate/cinnamic acid dioxygenase small subunit
VRAEVEEFLYREAELFDEWRLREWLAMLTDDVVYRVPVRIAKEKAEGESAVTGVSTEMFHLDEDRDSLELRVERLETGFAWAEEPPSRIRHHVSNVRVDDLAVRSNVLVYRSRWDKPDYDILSGERRDVFRRDDGELKLASRLVILDSTSVPTLNLTFFF